MLCLVWPLGRHLVDPSLCVNDPPIAGCFLFLFSIWPLVYWLFLQWWLVDGWGWVWVDEFGRSGWVFIISGIAVALIFFFVQSVASHFLLFESGFIIEVWFDLRYSVVYHGWVSITSQFLAKYKWYFQNSTKYNCNLQVFPLNSVWRKMSSREIASACFSLFPVKNVCRTGLPALPLVNVNCTLLVASISVVVGAHILWVQAEHWSICTYTWYWHLYRCIPSFLHSVAFKYKIDTAGFGMEAPV